MSLRFPGDWRFNSFDHEIPISANQEFFRLVKSIAAGDNDQQDVLEDFKSAFGENARSSDASWAESDLAQVMGRTRVNAADFVDKFHTGVENARRRGVAVPTIESINRILSTHGVPLAIENDLLVLTSGDIELADSVETSTTSLTRFVLGPLIGRGGFGDVFKVTRTTKIGTYHFAMKVLSPSVFVTDVARAEARFKREMDALQRLQHRGIIQFIEAGYDAELRPYFLMPFVEGRDLRESLSGAAPSRVLRLFSEILLAIDFAHANGVVHRDLKPTNILVREADDQPLILDFGCAYLLDDLDDGLTTSLIGTSAYVPLEVHRDPKNRTVTQDVYACGVLLYEVIANRLPRPEDYEPIESHFPHYAGIDRVIQDALAPERTRIQSAAEMQARLAGLSIVS